MPLMKKTPKSDRGEDTIKRGIGGKYSKKPLSPQVAEYYHGSVVRHPTTARRSDQTVSSQRGTRSLSVPSLHATDALKTKSSPPPSPKQRSKSVRLNATKKTLSFKRLKKLFGSHSELGGDGGGILSDDHHIVGTYKPLGRRPTSLGGSSDCSNSSITHDFSRCNSLRDSSRSRISQYDNVFSGRQASYDSADYNPHHVQSGSTDSSLRPFSVAYMPRSNSSASLKNFGVQTKVVGAGGDFRHYSLAAIPGNSTSIELSFPEDRASTNPSHRPKQQRHLHRTPAIMDDSESLWEDSQSFTYVNTPVVPSDPEYKQIAEELMSVSPKSSNEFGLQTDPRRISDASVDPRRVSNDSGVESSSNKPNRSLPSTPIAQSFNSVRTGGTSTPENRPGSPHGYLSQESIHSVPSGWDLVYTPQGVPYYLDHKTQSTQWKLPKEQDDSIGLPLPSGWEVVTSSQYGTYYVNHNNKTAIYQHPLHTRPPPPYQRPHRYEREPKLSRERRTPARSHSHRSTQNHRVLDPYASLPRRSKSFQKTKEHGGDEDQARVSHERQLSTMTYVPPSPYQIKEIPAWLKDYAVAPCGSKMDTNMQRYLYTNGVEDLNGMDTMIKRLFKKASELVVKKYEYYRVAVQQEMDERQRSRHVGHSHRGVAPHANMQLQDPPSSSSQISHDFPRHQRPSAASSVSHTQPSKVITNSQPPSHSFAQHPSSSKSVQNHVHGKEPPPLELGHPSSALPQQQYSQYAQQPHSPHTCTHKQQQQFYNMVNHQQKQPTAHPYYEPESNFELLQSSDFRPTLSQASRYDSLKSTHPGNGDAMYSGTNHYHTASNTSIYPPSSSGRVSSLQQRMPNSDILQNLEETFV